MHPILLDLGPATIYTYGVLLAAAYLLGLKLAMVRAAKRGLDEARVLDLGIYIIISALAGAKLLLVITDAKTFLSNPAELLSLARSGGVFYGGLILVMGFVLITGAVTRGSRRWISMRVTAACAAMVASASARAAASFPASASTPDTGDSRANAHSCSSPKR